VLGEELVGLGVEDAGRQAGQHALVQCDDRMQIGLAKQAPTQHMRPGRLRPCFRRFGRDAGREGHGTISA